MRISILAVAIVGSLVAAGCSRTSGDVTAAHQRAPAAVTRLSAQLAAHRIAPRIAGLPDHGSLLAYERQIPPRQQGASTSYPVQLSEAHAIRAIAEGGMVIETPDGHPVRLQYSRAIEHPDGNWTWVGHVAGNAGQQAILTFGDKAVFGTIPTASGELEVTTRGGRAWVVQTDPHKAADAALTGSDFAELQGGNAAELMHRAGAVHVATAAAIAPTKQSAPTSAMATVDLVLGYTTGFKTRWNGTSGANTRLNFIVDLANQALYDSQVAGQFRLVHTVEVNFADNTTNRSALLALSGVTCTNTATTGQHYLPDTGVNCNTATVPAALQPLLDARARYGGDLVSLVRNFVSPDNQSCGVAWLLGGAQTPLNATSAAFGLSVVSDSGGLDFPSNNNTCRNATLAHEIGHNLGLAHNAASAAGSDDSNSDGNLLDPEEYGRFADSFGYSTGADAGNFYTIMSVPVSGQTEFRLFSNPRISACSGHPCGVTGEADNARTLGQTFPIVAAFRQAATPNQAAWLRGDFDGDGKADILWRNTITGANGIWKSANSATPQSVTTVGNLAWNVAGIGDFNGDGKDDILWRNVDTGANGIWRSANSATPQSVTTVATTTVVAGVADFDGDGKADILWRNTVTGANGIWRSGNSGTAVALATVADMAWVIAGTGDFDGDGKADILWRNINTGSNALWRSGNSATAVSLTAVTNTAWGIAGVADFNGDGKDDILWRNISTGANALWLSANSATPQNLVAVTGMAWWVAGVGDFDHDGKADILWRNGDTGANGIWRSGNAATPMTVTTVALTWIVAG